MGLLDNDKYIKADISGYETEVENLISEYIDSIKGETEEQQRSNLPILKRDIHGTIDYIMEHKTSDYRVDGYTIRSMLLQVVQTKIESLPPLEDEGVI